jgi:hypothetical protein
MTSLLLIPTVIALLGCCLLIGKYNKSDNLAIILATALLGGMAGGAIVNKLTGNDDEKKNGSMQVISPTQESPATSIDLFAMLDDTSVGTLSAAKPVSKGKEILACDNRTFAPSKRNGEILVLPSFLSVKNRGGPTILFDTS